MSTHVGDLSQVTAIPQSIRERLQEVVQRHQWHEKAFRLAGLITLAVALSLVMVAVDLVLEIESATWRWIGWLMAISIAIVVGRWWQRSLRRSLSYVEAAWHVEAIRPDMEERLSSTVEFLGQPTSTDCDEGTEHVSAHDYSSALISALSAEASQRVATVKSEDVPVRVIWPVVWALAGTCIALLALTIASPAGVFCSLRNWMMPWAEPMFPALKADLSPGDITVVEGARVEIRAKLLHRQSPFVLEYWSGDLAPETKSMSAWHQPAVATKNTPAELAATLTARQVDIFYRVRSGKRVSPTNRITVLPQPKIEAITARVKFPEYSELPDEVVTDTAQLIPLLIGSELIIHVHADHHATLAQFSWTDRGNPPLRVESFQFKYSAQQTGAYSGEIRATSEQGVDSTPLPIRIQVHADSPPEIQITNPTLPRFHSQRDRELTVEFVGSDDLGIDRVELLYKPLESPQDEPPSIVETSLVKLLDAEEPTYQGRAVISFRMLPEQAAGATVWLRAFDRRGIEYGGPQSAETQPIVIEFGMTTSTPLEQQLAADQQSILQALENARQQLQLAQDHVEGLADYLDDPTLEQTDAELRDQLLDHAQQQLAKGQQALQDLADEMDRAQSDLSELAEDNRQLAESDLAEARNQLDRFPLLDDPQEQRELVERAERTVAEAREKLDNLANELQQKFDALAWSARLKDLADQQEQLAGELDAANNDGQDEVERDDTEQSDQESVQDDSVNDQKSNEHDERVDRSDGTDQIAEKEQASSEQVLDEWKERQQQIARELEQLQPTDSQQNQEELERQADLAESLANRARELAERVEKSTNANVDSSESNDEGHHSGTEKQMGDDNNADQDQQVIANELAELQQQSAELARSALPNDEAEQLAETAQDKLQQAAQSVENQSADSQQDRPQESPAESLQKASDALQQIGEACRECAACQNPGNAAAQPSRNR
ncbi:MAG TPA: hypothetical protein PKD54_06335, partial [Pirellulaceae bacterium]|nr:hypothetical protein [Pirellulaceae bacterium]